MLLKSEGVSLHLWSAAHQISAITHDAADPQLICSRSCNLVGDFQKQSAFSHDSKLSAMTPGPLHDVEFETGIPW